MRTTTYNFQEFMQRREKESKLAFATGATLPILMSPSIVGAEEAVPANTDGLYDRTVEAFDPLVVLAQALAYPIASIVVLGGALFIMIGNKEKGFTLMQGAALGYILVQMTPLLLQVLVDAMGAVS